MRMRNKIVHVFIIIPLLLVGSVQVKAQSCYNFHSSKGCVSKLEKDFRLYGQSESALLVIDSTSSLPVIFYGNKDYIINVCTEKGYYPVHFVIKEFETHDVLYDNMEDDYIESVGMTFEDPVKVIFNVTLLAFDIEPVDFGEDDACVGIHIQWKRTARTGF
jgi:hypothetical protein